MKVMIKRLFLIYCFPSFLIRSLVKITIEDIIRITIDAYVIWIGRPSVLIACVVTNVVVEVKVVVLMTESFFSGRPKATRFPGMLFILVPTIVNSF